MNKNSDILLFYLLKNAVSQQFLTTNHASSLHISEWKGQDIVLFQEDLLQSVKGQVSEKWFYTYLKSEQIEKIPRIDMLNLLSKYVEFNNWEHFKNEHANEIENQKKESFPNTNSNSKSFKKRKKWMVILVGIILVSILIYWLIPQKNTYQFCFIDADLNSPITTPIEVKILKTNETALYQQTNEDGCFTFESSDSNIKLVVQSPYHKTDTIVRYAKDQKGREVLELITDEYALMMNYLTHSNVEDWKKRRKKWNDLIDENALIYRVWPQAPGLEVMSKQEFVNYVTLPTQSLKDFALIEKKVRNGKITKLKFKTTSDEN